MPNKLDPHPDLPIDLPTAERIPLGQKTITFGRSPEATVQLADPNVSRNHAEIRPSGNGWLLVDLGSTNGTRVNGKAVSVSPLQDGDRIGVGTTELVYRAGS